MKLLPHVFKWIGITIFFIGFIFGAIDDGRKGFLEGYNETSHDPVKTEFKRILPEKVSQIADYVLLFGLLIYVLSKNKRDDEFTRQMRYEAAYIVFVITIIFILILFMIDPNLRLEPSTFIGAQLVLYLIIRHFRKISILDW
jgi:hypothetical protein